MQIGNHTIVKILAKKMLNCNHIVWRNSAPEHNITDTYVFVFVYIYIFLQFLSNSVYCSCISSSDVSNAGKFCEWPMYLSNLPAPLADNIVLYIVLVYRDLYLDQWFPVSVSGLLQDITQSITKLLGEVHICAPQNSSWGNSLILKHCVV